VYNKFRCAEANETGDHHGPCFVFRGRLVLQFVLTKNVPCFSLGCSLGHIERGVGVVYESADCQGGLSAGRGVTAAKRPARGVDAPLALSIRAIFGLGGVSQRDTLLSKEETRVPGHFVLSRTLCSTAQDTSILDFTIYTVQPPLETPTVGLRDRGGCRRPSRLNLARETFHSFHRLPFRRKVKTRPPTGTLTFQRPGWVAFAFVPVPFHERGKRGAAGRADTLWETIPDRGCRFKNRTGTKAPGGAARPRPTKGNRLSNRPRGTRFRQASPPGSSPSQPQKAEAVVKPHSPSR